MKNKKRKLSIYNDPFGFEARRKEEKIDEKKRSLRRFIIGLAIVAWIVIPTFFLDPFYSVLHISALWFSFLLLLVIQFIWSFILNDTKKEIDNNLVGTLLIITWFITYITMIFVATMPLLVCEHNSAESEVCQNMII